MPEGDTIFQMAAALRPMLVGQRVRAARARAPGPQIERVIGTSVTSVESSGKHLLIRFDNGLTLHTHMRMAGSWHRYAPGERWRLPEWRARVVLEVAEHVVVCFNAPIAELMEDRAISKDLHPALAALGPDLLADTFDSLEAFQRLRPLSPVEIAEALLDQRVMAGVGNVFKSEVLFIEGVHPWTHVGELTDDKLRAVIATARRLLLENARPGRPHRVTTRGDPAARGSLWVYARANRPCFRCGSPIGVRRQGGLNRPTYWCPGCQPATSSPARESPRTARP